MSTTPQPVCDHCDDSEACAYRARPKGCVRMFDRQPPEPPGPLCRAVEVADLQLWMAEAQAGTNPEVIFRPGQEREMMDAAYASRGDVLRGLAKRIAAYLD